MNSKASIINTALLTVCLGVMGWVGIKATESAEVVAGLKVSVQGVSESVSKIERRLEDTVSRREYDVRILAIEAAQRSTDARLREIDVELLKLKRP